MRATGLLDAPEEDAFARLARLAAFALGAPVGLVSLLDDRREFFAGSYGREPDAGRETPVAESFCQYVVRDGRPLVVADARTHPLVRESSAVQAGVLAYVGVPLRMSTQEVIGTLCVTDTREREWTEAQIGALTDLAANTMTEIELRLVARRLRDQERQHAELLDLTEDLICVANADGVITYANRAWLQTMGFTIEELRQLRPVDLVAPEHRGRYVEEARRLARGDTIADLELVLIAKDGSRHVMRGGATAVFRDGMLVSTRAIYRDVTKERYGEALGTRLIATIEATPDLVAIATRDGTLVYLNRRGKELIGLPEDSALSAVALGDLFTDEELTTLTSEIIPMVLWKGTWTGEARLVAKGGEHIPVSLVIVAHPSTREDDQSPYFLSVVMRDLRGRVRAETRLRESELRFRSILDRVRAPALIVEPDHRIRFVNEFLLELTGRTRAETEGIPILDLMNDDRGPTPEMIARGEVPPHLETELIARTGEPRAIAWDTVVLHDEKGSVSGVAAIGQDVTERRRVESMKDQVIAIVGHELRSPIGAVRGALQVLSKRLRNLGQQEQELFGMAVRNTDRLLRLVNDLLDYERLSAGAVPFDQALVRADTLIAQAVDVVAVTAEAAGVKLETESEPSEVWVDQGRIVQVLVNFLSNAVKFSPEGGTIRLDSFRKANDVVFRVRDQGRGIPADKLESVFDRFTQVHTSDARRGSGLGLAIARAIVRQHGGQIWVESTLGEGSVFAFSIPVPEVALAEH